MPLQFFLVRNGVVRLGAARDRFRGASLMLTDALLTVLALFFLDLDHPGWVAD